MVETLEFASTGEARSAGAYLARVLKADSGAAVRLRARRSQDGRDGAGPVAGGDGAVLLMAARLPNDVLALRPVSARMAGDPAGGDRVLSAAYLLEALGRAVAPGAGGIPLPAAGEDPVWGGPLPPESGWLRREVLPESVVHSLAESAVLRVASAGGDSVTPSGVLGQTVVTVDPDRPDALAVPLRLVVAAVRMGFVSGPVRVVSAPGWVRLGSGNGDTATRTMPSLRLTPVRPVGRPAATRQDRA